VAEGDTAVDGWTEAAGALAKSILEGSAVSLNIFDAQLESHPRLIQTSAMRTLRLCQKLTVWLRAYRPLRWVETIVADYSDWSPSD
jgi:hypothetical protein